MCYLTTLKHLTNSAAWRFCFKFTFKTNSIMNSFNMLHYAPSSGCLVITMITFNSLSSTPSWIDVTCLCSACFHLNSYLAWWSHWSHLCLIPSLHFLCDVSEHVSILLHTRMYHIWNELLCGQFLYVAED